MKDAAFSWPNPSSAASERLLGVAEAPFSRGQPTEISGGDVLEEACVRALEHCGGFFEELPRLVGSSLVGEDLGDVPHDRRRSHDVADSLAQPPALLVVLERIVPAALVVRVDAEVVEDVRLTEQVAQLLVDRQGDAAKVPPFRPAQRRVREVQEVVAVGGALEILDRERGGDDVAAPADALGQLSLAQPHPGRREAEPHEVSGLLLALRQRLRRGAAVRVAAQRADVVALALADDALLEQQRGLATRCRLQAGRPVDTRVPHPRTGLRAPTRRRAPPTRPRRLRPPARERPSSRRARGDRTPPRPRSRTSLVRARRRRASSSTLSRAPLRGGSAETGPRRAPPSRPPAGVRTLLPRVREAHADVDREGPRTPRRGRARDGTGTRRQRSGRVRRTR